MTPTAHRHRAGIPKPPSPDEREYQKATEAINCIPQLLSELREYAQHYVAARRAMLTASVRSGVMKLGVGVLVLLAGGAAIVTSVTLLLIGIAQLLGRATGGRMWLGNLIVGGGLLLLVGLGAWLVVRGARRAGIRETVGEFESRKDLQRQRFARSVWERSGAVPLRETKDNETPA